MQCKNHPDVSGVNTCNECGQWFCEDCTFQRGGRNFCPSCAAQQAAAATHTHHEHARHEHTAYMTRLPSHGTMFVLSICLGFLPGLNYMYMGLIKRGLAAMSAFSLLVYLIITSSWTFPGLLFGFALPVLMLSTIFDSFRILRRMEAGEVVTDNIDDVMHFFHRNKVLAVLALVFFVIIPILGSFIPWVMRGPILPIILVILAVKLLFNKRRR
ncbi:MAG: hypothetical protein FWG64_03345 [Firmicutes bacterium]|nr:hypothetical protein [Bacillota bacterium]